MKAIKRIAALLGTMFLLTGCGKGINYDLPDDPIKFYTQSYISPKDKDDGYQIIEYSGRRFIPYGTIRRSLKGEDVGDCLGYIVQDGVEDKNRDRQLSYGDIYKRRNAAAHILQGRGYHRKEYRYSGLYP